MLGAAGLVRAYGKSATMGIEAAGIIKRQLCIRTDIILEYTLLGKVQSMLGAKRYLINEISYGQDVQISCSVPVDEYELFVSELTEATNARALVNEGEKEYITVFS